MSPSRQASSPARATRRGDALHNDTWALSLGDAPAWSRIGTLDDAWMLELAPAPHWVALHTTGNAPPALADHFAAFDPATHRFFVVANAPQAASGKFDGVSIWALSGDASPKWEHYCPQGSRPARADGALWMDGGLFLTSQGSAWRFDPSTPTCD